MKEYVPPHKWQDAVKAMTKINHAYTVSIFRDMADKMENVDK